MENKAPIGCVSLGKVMQLQRHRKAIDVLALT